MFHTCSACVTQVSGGAAAAASSATAAFSGAGYSLKGPSQDNSAVIVRLLARYLARSLACSLAYLSAGSVVIVSFLS